MTNVQNDQFLPLLVARIRDVTDRLATAKASTRQSTQDANDLKILTGLLISEVKKLPNMK